MDKEAGSLVLDNSKFIRYLSGIYKTWKYRVLDYSRTSKVLNSAQEIKNNLYLLPVRTSSIILVTMILINIFFSVLFLNKEIKLLGWFIRVTFLFLGLSGLFCNISWKEIKKTSFLLRLVYHK